MKRKHLVTALSLLLFVAVVATGVHVMHKKAYAIPTYTVECVMWAGNPIGVEGVLIKFAIEGEPIQYIETDENGIASTTTENPEQWVASIEDVDWVRVNGDPHQRSKKILRPLNSFICLTRWGKKCISAL